MEKTLSLIQKKIWIEPVKLLQVLCFCVLGGRAWQQLRWISPFEGTWNWPHAIVLGVGTFWLFLAILSLVSDRINTQKIIQTLLISGSISLLLLMLASWQAKAFQIAQLIEHTIQWTLPAILAYALFSDLNSPRFILGLKIATALTFLGHGLYAAGVYEVPGNFIAMTTSILGVSVEQAKIFLTIAGILDFLVVISLFIPKLQKYAIVYAIIWGSLTAFARVVAYMDGTDVVGSLDRWLFETVYRLGHGGVPLLLYIVLGIGSKKES